MFSRFGLSGSGSNTSSSHLASVELIGKLAKRKRSDEQIRANIINLTSYLTHNLGIMKRILPSHVFDLILRQIWFKMMPLISAILFVEESKDSTSQHAYSFRHKQIGMFMYIYIYIYICMYVYVYYTLYYVILINTNNNK